MDDIHLAQESGSGHHFSARIDSAAHSLGQLRGYIPPGALWPLCMEYQCHYITGCSEKDDFLFSCRFFLSLDRVGGVANLSFLSCWRQ